MKSTSQIMQMEREFTESTQYSESEVAKLQDELAKLRDRYDRYVSYCKLKLISFLLSTTSSVPLVLYNGIHTHIF